MTAAAERVAQAIGDDPARAVLLAETDSTGRSCTLTATDLGLGQTHFPEPSVVGATGEPGAAMRLLRQRCETGMVARGLDRDERAVRQLDYELECIGRLSYEGYYLAVAQVVADTRALGIRVAARGSGVKPGPTKRQLRPRDSRSTRSRPQVGEPSQAFQEAVTFAFSDCDATWERLAEEPQERVYELVSRLAPCACGRIEMDDQDGSRAALTALCSTGTGPTSSSSRT